MVAPRPPQVWTAAYAASLALHALLLLSLPATTLRACGVDTRAPKPLLQLELRTKAALNPLAAPEARPVPRTEPPPAPPPARETLPSREEKPPPAPKPAPPPRDAPRPKAEVEGQPLELRFVRLDQPGLAPAAEGFVAAQDARAAVATRAKVDAENEGERRQATRASAAVLEVGNPVEPTPERTKTLVQPAEVTEVTEVTEVSEVTEVTEVSEVTEVTEVIEVIEVSELSELSEPEPAVRPVDTPGRETSPVWTDEGVARGLRVVKTSVAETERAPSLEHKVEPSLSGEPPSPSPSPARPLPAAQATDPLARLRLDLEHATATDRAGSAPQRLQVAQEGQEASAQAVFEANRGEDTSVNAVATPLGRYLQQAYTEVARRWRPQDLPPMLRALKAQGEVTLAFDLYPNGEIRGLRLVLAEGPPELEAVAVAALRERLPRFPDEVREAKVHCLFTFHYGP